MHERIAKLEAPTFSLRHLMDHAESHEARLKELERIMIKEEEWDTGVKEGRLISPDDIPVRFRTVEARIAALENPQDEQPEEGRDEPDEIVGSGIPCYIISERGQRLHIASEYHSGMIPSCGMDFSGRRKATEEDKRSYPVCRRCRRIASTPPSTTP